MFVQGAVQEGKGKGRGRARGGVRGGGGAHLTNTRKLYFHFLPPNPFEISSPSRPEGVDDYWNKTFDGSAIVMVQQVFICIQITLLIRVGLSSTVGKLTSKYLATLF